MRVLVLMLLAGLPLYATTLDLPDQKELPGQFAAVIPGGHETSVLRWERRTLPRGAVTLAEGEELFFHVSHWQLAKLKADTPAVFSHVRHLIVYGGGGGGNAECVRRIGEVLPALRSLNLALLNCCGELENEDLTHLGKLAHLHTLSISQVAVSLEWLKDLPNADRIECLAVLLRPTERAANLEHLGRLPALTHLTIYDEAKPRVTDSSQHALKGDQLGNLKSLPKLRVLNAGVRGVSLADVGVLREFKHLEAVTLRLTGAELGALEALQDFKPRLSLDLSEVGDMWMPVFKGLSVHSLRIQSAPRLTSKGLKELAGCAHLHELLISGKVMRDVESWKQVGAIESLRRFEIVAEDYVTAPLTNGTFAAQLAGLKHLEALKLGEVTDEVLKEISAITSLRSLFFRAVRLKGDEGVRHLPALENLEKLTVMSAGKWDARALEHLKKMTHLESLTIWSSRFPEEDLAAFMKAMEDKVAQIRIS